MKSLDMLNYIESKKMGEKFESTQNKSEQLKDKINEASIKMQQAKNDMENNTNKRIESDNEICNKLDLLWKLSKNIVYNFIDITREEFNLLSATQSNTIYRIRESDGTVTIIMGNNE